MAAKTGNPFGLVDSRVLAELRRGEEIAEDTITRNRLSGMQYGASVAGTLLGRILGDATGGGKSPRSTRAAEVTAAQQRAQAVVDSKPTEMKPSNLHQQRIDEGMALIQQLHASGLMAEADTVRTKLLDLEKQDLELQKLDGEVTGIRESNAAKRIDRLYDEATIQDRVTKTRADAMQSSVEARVAISTEGYKVETPALDFEKKLDDLKNNRALAPFIQKRAEQEATISALQARHGGTTPQLVAKQMARDHVLEELSRNPDDKWALKRLTELNMEIESDTLNVARNISNWQPTNAVLTQTQDSLRRLGGFSEQAQSILKQMENSSEDAFGGAAEMRIQAASVLSQGLPLLGAPQALTSKVADFVASANTLDTRSQARQLRSDLAQWISDGRMNKSVQEEADSLLQVLDNPYVDKRSATIALTNLVHWLAKHQETDIRILEEGMKGALPATAGSLAEQLEAFQQGQ